MARSSLSRRGRLNFRRRMVLEALERRELLASYTTPEDTRLVVSDPAFVSATIVGQPLHGKVFLTDVGGFAYEPNLNYNGPDRFLYVVLNETTPNVPPSNTNPTTNVPGVVHEVSLTVTPVNDAPVARGDQYSVHEGVALSIEAPGVLKNDSDVDNNTFTAKLDKQPEHGTLKLNENGNFIYEPVLGYTGPDKFTYVANDGSAVSEAATVSLFIAPARPEARDDSYTVNQNSELVVAAPGVLANDKGVNGRPLTASLEPGDENAPKHGTVALAADGSVVYKPAAGFFGSDSFVYRATDVSPALDPAGSNNTTSPLPPGFDLARVYVFVRRTEPFVVANDDVFIAIQNTPLAIGAPGVLKNDYAFVIDTASGSPSGAPGTVPTIPLKAKILTQPVHGTVELAADGGFKYVPGKNHFGTVTFTYQAVLSTTTGEGTATAAGDTVVNVPGAPIFAGDDIATVTIHVRAPEARNDFYETLIGTELKVEAPGVLKNDGRPEGLGISAKLERGPQNGELALNADGSFSYQPKTGFSGTDTFTYRAIVNPPNADVPPSDGILTSDNGTPNVPGGLATVTIFVKPLPLPQAHDDFYRTLEGAALEIEAPGVLLNDRGVEGHRLTAKLVSEVTSGELKLNEDGSFSYKPVEGFSGFAWFTYRAVDVDAPTPAANTTATSDNLLFAPRPIDVAMVTIYVQPAQLPVYAFDDAYKAWANQALEIAAPGVLGNDTIVPPPMPLTPDLDSPTIGSNSDGSRPWPIPPKLTAKLLTRPDNGELSFNEDGSFKYVPKDGFSGMDTFTYQAIAGDGDAVMPATATASMLSMPCAIDAAGTVILNTTILPCPVPPDDIATVTIFVRAPEPPPGPVAVNDHFLTAAHTTLEVRKPGVLANDYVRHLSPIAGTVDNLPVRPPLVAVLLTQAENGTVSLNPDGSFKYEPKDGFTGIDKFTYQAMLGTPGTNTPSTTESATDAADGILPNLSNVATVTIRVVPAVAHNDSYSTLQDTELKVEAPGVLGNDDGGSETQPLKATLLRGPLHGTVELMSDGSFVYVPKPGYVGPDLFTYRAGDGSVVGDPNTAASNAVAANTLTNNAVDVGVVKIYVRPKTPDVNANDDKFVTRKNVTLTIAPPGVLANDLRPANVPLMASIVERPAKGTLELRPDGGFTYAPEADFVGAVKFTYRASLANTTGAATDGSIGGSIATVTIYVLGEDQAPGFIPGGNQTTTDESGEQKIADWATLMSIGADGTPANFVVTTDKPELFAKAPSIDATGQLAYTPAPNASGTARVTVSIAGAAGESAAFEIQVDKPHPLYNAAKPCDVDADLHVAAGDALEIINYLNALGSTPATLPEGEAGALSYYDVNGDGTISAGDALEVINLLNAGLAGVGPADGGEGEHAAATDLSILALTADDAGGSNQRRRRSS